MKKRMRTPCDAGFNCPYWSHDEDGIDLCTAPEVTERGGIEGKKGRYNLYPYIGSLDICPIVVDYSPIDEWLKSMDKKMDCDEGRICPKCGKVMVLCENERTYHQFWECDGCGYREDE